MVARMAKADKAGFADALLDWYDVHARDLPWRVGPAARAEGVRPDPYRVWLSEVMLQQTTVATVTPRFTRFLERWPQVEDLAAAPLDDVLGEWAGLGYYARARNLHACAVEVAARGGFPETAAALETLPGIGPYTAAAIAAIAFDEPAVVVDGNVDRVMVRLHRIEQPIRDVKPDIRAAAAALTPDARAGCYAQALMDLGATICRPGVPDCLLCPVRSFCAAHGAGIADTLPVKPPKKMKPTRNGTVFIGERTDGAILAERRPAKGLLGGMLGLPGDAWTEEESRAAPPFEADWRELGQVRHTFTHFHLVLSVQYAPLVADQAGFVPVARDARGDFPTVFAKALALIPEDEA